MGKFTTIKLSNGDQLDVQEPKIGHYLKAQYQVTTIKDKNLANLELTILMTISLLHKDGKPITREYFEDLSVNDAGLINNSIDAALQPLNDYVKNKL